MATVARTTRLGHNYIDINVCVNEITVGGTPLASTLAAPGLAPDGGFDSNDGGGWHVAPHSNFAIFVNRRTGERVQFLRPSNTHEEGKARLIFEETENGHFLKQIS